MLEILIGLGALVAVILVFVRNRNAENDSSHDAGLASPGTGSDRYTSIARELIDDITEQQARALAEAADEALDNGDPGLTVHGAAGKPITLPADFLEVLLDELVDRYPELRELIEAPRPLRAKEPRPNRYPPVLARGLSHPAQIIYRDARGQLTERPIIIHTVNGSAQTAPTYIFAFCEKRNGVRMFRLDRIMQLIDDATGEVLTDTAAVHAWAIERVAEARRHE